MYRLKTSYSILKKLAITMSVIFAVLLLDKLLSLFAEKFIGFSLHEYNWPELIVQIYHFAVICSLFGGLLVWLLYLILWLFIYLYQEKQLPSLLSNVNIDQEQKILQLLKRVAVSSKGSDKMNRAEVANFLATLKALGCLEDGGDYNNLRLWVEQITGMKDNDKIHFNEAYKRALEKKGDSRYMADIKKILS